MGLEALASAERGLTLEPTLTDVDWDGDALRINATGRLIYADGTPVLFVRRSERLLWQLPVELDIPIPDEALDMTSALEIARGELLVRSRKVRDEFFVPGGFDASFSDVGDERVTLSVAVEGRLDVETAAQGSRLAKGTWDVLLRIWACGWGPEVRLGSRRAESLGELSVRKLGPKRRLVWPYWTINDNLSITVGKRPPNAQPDERPDEPPTAMPTPPPAPPQPAAKAVPAPAGAGPTVRGVLRRAFALRRRRAS